MRRRNPRERLARDLTRDRNDGSARSTFRVARAHRVLADTLPDVVVSSLPRRRALSIARLADEQEATRSAAPAAVQRVVPARREEPRALDMSPLKPDTCKRRPDPKKGGGTGRAFVPWCNRR